MISINHYGRRYFLFHYDYTEPCRVFTPGRNCGSAQTKRFSSSQLERKVFPTAPVVFLLQKTAACCVPGRPRASGYSLTVKLGAETQSARSMPTSGRGVRPELFSSAQKEICRSAALGAQSLSPEVPLSSFVHVHKQILPFYVPPVLV